MSLIHGLYFLAQIISHIYIYIYEVDKVKKYQINTYTYIYGIQYSS